MSAQIRDAISKMRRGIPCGIYVRNSSKKQVGNYRSVVQVETFQAICDEFGIPTILYDDQGRSGRTTVNRPRFQEMLSDVEQRKIQGLACLEFSRLTRDKAGTDAPVIRKALFGAGAWLITAEQIYKFQSPADNLNFDIQAAVVRFQSELQQSTAYGGIIKRAMADEVPSLRCKAPPGFFHEPCGLNSNKDPKYRVSIHDEDRPLIEWIFERLKIRTTHEVMVELNRRGEQSERWLKPNRAKGGTLLDRHLWDTKVLRRMIDNPIYYGVIEIGRFAKSPLFHQKLNSQVALGYSTTRFFEDLVLIPRDQWELVNQYQKTKPAIRKMRTRSDVETAPLLRGLLRCPSPECAGIMERSTRSNRAVVFSRMYTCRAKRQGVQHSGRHAVSEHLAVPFLKKVVVSLFQQLPYRESVQRALSTQERTEELSSIQNRIQLLERTVKLLIKRRVDDEANGIEMDEDLYYSSLKEYQAELRKLKEQAALLIKLASNEETLLNLLEFYSTRLEEYLDTCDSEMVAALFEAIFEPRSILFASRFHGRHIEYRLVDYQLRPEVAGLVGQALIPRLERWEYVPGLREKLEAQGISLQKECLSSGDSTLKSGYESRNATLPPVSTDLLVGILTRIPIAIQ